MRIAGLTTVALALSLVGRAQLSPCQRLLRGVVAEAQSIGDVLAEVRTVDCLGDGAADFVALDRQRDSLVLALARRDASIREASYSRPGQIDSVDRKVFAELTADIADRGFPRAGALSHEAHGGLLAIIWHNVRRDSATWHGFLPQLKQALERGDIRPFEYAQMVDAYAVRKGKTAQSFNSYLGAPGSPSADDARLGIGLRPASWTVDDVLRYCGCD